MCVLQELKERKTPGTASHKLPPLMKAGGRQYKEAKRLGFKSQFYPGGLCEPEHDIELL